MASLKPILLWGHSAGPNPLKIHIILEELNIPFEYKFIDFPDMKQEPFVSINPNGRVPAIQDPNTGITLWESGAIIEYIVDQYDKDHKLSYDTVPEKYLIQQWIAFQISGQGPYYGQAVWFSLIHEEKVQSAVDRYCKEIERVRSVLETHLAKSSSGWLVGDKMTVADISWIMWEQIASFLLENSGYQFQAKYPHYEAWYQKLLGRPTVKKVLTIRAKGLRGLRSVPDASDPE